MPENGGILGELEGIGKVSQPTRFNPVKTPESIHAMGLRYLLLLAAVTVIVLILRRQLSQRTKAPPHRQTRPVEDMVRCERCGLHVPRSQAIADGDRLFCCREHLEGGRRP